MMGSAFLLDGAALIALWWLAIGVAGLARARSVLFVGRILFPFGSAAGIALAALALYALLQPPQSVVLPLGLPDLPFHLRA